jgi:hypothetical protein
MPLPEPYERELERLHQEGVLESKRDAIFPQWLNARMLTTRVLTAVLPDDPGDLPSELKALLQPCANEEMVEWLLESAPDVTGGECLVHGCCTSIASLHV